MTYEERCIRNKIYAVEDYLLRCKNIQEQLKIRNELMKCRKQLQNCQNKYYQIYKGV